MTEQFGFWVACVVLIAVVAGGCDRTPKAWQCESKWTYEGNHECVLSTCGGITCDWEAK